MKDTFFRDPQVDILVSPVNESLDTCVNRMLRMREAADGLQSGRVSPR